MPDPVPVPRLPGAVAARAFGWYLDRLAGRHFTTVRWRRAEDHRGWGEVPLLFVANHTNWWDGFMAHQATRALGYYFQILMDAAGVSQYPVFRRFGAVPVDRSSPVRAVAGLEAVAGNLRPGVAVWLFPQGERRPAGERVRQTERGAAHLAIAAGRPVRIVPVGFRYPFLSEQLPEAFIALGGSWLAQGGTGRPGERRRVLAAEIEDRINGVLDQLDRALAEEDVSQFEVLIRGRLSVNKRMDRVRHATGLIQGPFEERNG